MRFEIKEKDLLARIGRLKTKSGVFETPALLPVINPAVQPIQPRKIRDVFGFEALMTNAYILKKAFKKKPIKEGLHRFLNFNGVIMTDSGAYQMLVYGDIETNPEEIVKYQEQIDTDIATILDWPTGWRVSKKYAEKTVNETLKRARELPKIKTRNDILWVGPVQGGKYLDLISKSAEEMGRLPFDVYALGSPTEVMKNYRFDVLVDMILTAKMKLPIVKPLHLFGAGHPFMFSLAVALGCDLFDSAAYALYAKENRYMTETGTFRLDELNYFPCICSACSQKTPKEISELPKEEKQSFLAEHNLYVCAAELKRIKQAIKDGRLWEYLEIRMRSHPSLFQALKKLKKYEEFIEENSPVVKKSGFFFFDSVGLMRPEIVRYKKRIMERYSPPYGADILVLVPQTRSKPFHKSKKFKAIKKFLRKTFGEKYYRLHICFYVAPFGVVPIELDEVYPLSQHETVLPLDKETIEYVADQTATYIKNTNYKAVVLLHDPENWNDTLLKACKRVCAKRKAKFEHLILNKESKAIINQF